MNESNFLENSISACCIRNILATQSSKEPSPSVDQKKNKTKNVGTHLVVFCFIFFFVHYFYIFSCRCLAFVMPNVCSYRIHSLHYFLAQNHCELVRRFIGRYIYIHVIYVLVSVLSFISVAWAKSMTRLKSNRNIYKPIRHWEQLQGTGIAEK